MFTMTSESSSFSWKGLVALIVILIIVSVVAFVLSSIESFLAGVIVLFIGFLLSFFRDDLKQALGLASQHRESTPPMDVEEEPLDKLDKMILLDLDKKIAKERQNIAKLISKYEEKPKKQDKIGVQIVEEATTLLALLDRAKAQAIQIDESQLVQHYESIASDVEKIREVYRK